MRRLLSNHLILALLPLAFAVFPGKAAAADENAEKSATRKPNDGWDITIGAGAVSLPEYPGSDEQKTRALPMINIRYGRFFLGGDGSAGGGGPGGGLGVYLYEDEHWRVGAMVSAGAFKARKEADDARLRGLGDIDGTARVGAFARYTQGWLSARLSVSSDVGDNRQGTLAELGLNANWVVSRQLVLSAGPSVTWANGEYMQTFFGIDALQSERSGRPQYRAGGGVSSIGFGASARYRFDEHWGLGAFASTSQLQGDAKDSPITQDKTQNVVGVFATYHF
ncbi:MipA/OmpV family protein [Rudaea cellulosilytica]|uniref:MipA/OmpV family protein n=1 Tax=Rudaea cellulosilytica TaxID=540746 RepID=UPI00036D9D26|nr:MipA/OmpV family protein [Rudaea cellulosilytica]